MVQKQPLDIYSYKYLLMSEEYENGIKSKKKKKSVDQCSGVIIVASPKPIKAPQQCQLIVEMAF